MCLLAEFSVVWDILHVRILVRRRQFNVMSWKTMAHIAISQSFVVADGRYCAHIQGVLD